eukprot:3933560-Amphidinium_carterae.3
MKLQKIDFNSLTAEEKNQKKKDWVKTEHKAVVERVQTVQEEARSTTEGNAGKWFFPTPLIKRISRTEFEKCKHRLPTRLHPVSNTIQYLWCEDYVKKELTNQAKQSRIQDRSRGTEHQPSTDAATSKHLSPSNALHALMEVIACFMNFSHDSLHVGGASSSNSQESVVRGVL